jgi:hypothetical protein
MMQVTAGRAGEFIKRSEGLGSALQHFVWVDNAIAHLTTVEHSNARCHRMSAPVLPLPPEFRAIGGAPLLDVGLREAEWVGLA